VQAIKEAKLQYRNILFLDDLPVSHENFPDQIHTSADFYLAVRRGAFQQQYSKGLDVTLKYLSGKNSSKFAELREFRNSLVTENSLQNMCLNLLNSDLGHSMVKRYYKGREELWGSGIILPITLEKQLIGPNAAPVMVSHLVKQIPKINQIPDTSSDSTSASDTESC